MKLKIALTMAAIIILIVVASYSKVQPTSCTVKPVGSFLDDRDTCGRS